MMLTKCCNAKREIETDLNGYPVRALCESCEASDPEMVYVEESK